MSFHKEDTKRLIKSVWIYSCLQYMAMPLVQLGFVMYWVCFEFAKTFLGLLSSPISNPKHPL
jgi:hypothetical protein